MSSTTLSRRSGIRAPSGSGRPRSRPSSSSTNVDPANNEKQQQQRHSYSASSGSESDLLVPPAPPPTQQLLFTEEPQEMTKEEERELTRGEARGEREEKVRGEEEVEKDKNIHTRLLNDDMFTRAYKPSFYSEPLGGSTNYDNGFIDYITIGNSNSSNTRNNTRPDSVTDGYNISSNHNSNSNNSDNDNDSGNTEKAKSKFISPPSSLSPSSPSSPPPPYSQTPRVKTPRPNTVHQDTLIGNGNIYSFHEHNFPMPPRSRSPNPQTNPQTALHQQLEQQQKPSPSSIPPHSPLQEQGAGVVNQALSRSEIPPRRDSIWLGPPDETGTVDSGSTVPAFHPGQRELDYFCLSRVREEDEDGDKEQEQEEEEEEEEEKEERKTDDREIIVVVKDFAERTRNDNPWDDAGYEQQPVKKFQLRDPSTPNFRHAQAQAQTLMHGHSLQRQSDQQSFPIPPVRPRVRQGRRPRTPPSPIDAFHNEDDAGGDNFKQYTNELETQETLKRERTRILQRTVVSSYRQINYKDITNVQPLKKGGFGEIHTAEWSRLKVVLKRALADGIEQFEQELEILKRVHDYDFIVPFYGVTMDPIANVRCMVMKHCANGNLCQFLEKNHTTLTWAERYRLSIEITKGLEFLHKSGFYHRDLHSGNILLDDKRTAMLCDFGLSRSVNKTRTMDMTATVGVASFLAPERFPAERPVYSAACDIYSLGVIFWHITSGRIPFANRLGAGTGVALLLRQLMEGLREEIEPDTPVEYRNLLTQCWDVNPSERPPIDMIIAVLQTLMAEPSEPVHLQQQHGGYPYHHPHHRPVAAGFTVPSSTTSAALPVPPELDTKMASLERASNTLNKMVFDITDPTMRETVDYIHRMRRRFREQRMPKQPYSLSNPPTVPIYLCPLVGDIEGFEYHLSVHDKSYNPINESSEQTGDTALHLACLFLESPLDTIKVLVELGADINLENLQGYTPLMILVSSNTQYCYEALKYLVMRGARIPAYIRNPITPLGNAQTYAKDIVNESRQLQMDNSVKYAKQAKVNSITHNNSSSNNRKQRGGNRFYAQGRPLIHVVAAMQDDYRILDCLCEAGLDPAITFGGENALVAAAAHLKIKNMEWLLNNDLDISSQKMITRATKVVRLLHAPVPTSPTDIGGFNVYGHGTMYITANHKRGGASGPGTSSDVIIKGSTWGRLDPKEFPEDIRELGQYSWAGAAYKGRQGTDQFNKDMIGPVLQLLEQWSGHRLNEARKQVATKLMKAHRAAVAAMAAVAAVASNNATTNATPPILPRSPSPMRIDTVSASHHHHHNSPRPSSPFAAPSSLVSPGESVPYIPPPPANLNPGRGSSNINNGSSRHHSLRKNQRHLIDHVLRAKAPVRY
ncbi:hypothetical protein BCR41DRAFT_28657 [Lobosporangium transversale]|uniref:Protein kinase domain-containing protein n=1 Tax=Lobosporangium transversale TaxID=64571 RepID=A0A1Y2GS21_9FUNG|nr:hypothetical protein BCR41DRAFT_28657 [Lobosporangium transversale]ORZ20948.1 hypothetical protein BCR41DRAFT_28657 [Lobosporangium transversale]|eukprot:XP_021882857.1 hypothetical protein BCR41DRAFT_28657 [Lobosporangium transversale]